MRLSSPFLITPRLECGVKIGNVFISISLSGFNSEHRAVYTYSIDGDCLSHTASDLESGCGSSGDLQEGMETLLCFLGSAGESYDCNGMDGENSDLFPEAICRWASENSDEISMLQYEIENTPGLIEETE